MSATFGSCILLTKPDAFKNYILGSPATLFDNHLVHEYESVAKLIPKSLEANVFISVGSDESQNHINHAISLVQFLKTRKADGSQVDLRVIESAVQSLYWLAEVSD